MTWKELRHHLQHPDHKWKIYVLLGVVAYFIAINQIIKIRPDHIFLSLPLPYQVQPAPKWPALCIKK